MPAVFYQCDNFVSCQNYVERPGLCDKCKEDARKLAETIESQDKDYVWYFIPNKKRSRHGRKP